MTSKILKLTKKQKNQFQKIMNSINNFYKLTSDKKELNKCIQRIELDHDMEGELEFEFNEHGIRIYSINAEWQVYKEYDDIYFDVIIQDKEIHISTNAITHINDVPESIMCKILIGLNFILKNSELLINTIDKITSKIKDNIKMKEFFPRRYGKL